MVANTGWTWAEVGRLTIPRLRALHRQWRSRPPVHHLVAAYLGYDAEGTEAKRDEQMHTLMSSMPVNSNAPKLDDRAWGAANSKDRHGQ